MKVQHKCGFWYDSSLTIDSGSIHWDKDKGILIGLSADASKLANIADYISDDTCVYFKDTKVIKIFNKANKTWYDM